MVGNKQTRPDADEDAVDSEGQRTKAAKNWKPTATELAGRRASVTKLRRWSGISEYASVQQHPRHKLAQMNKELIDQEQRVHDTFGLQKWDNFRARRDQVVETYITIRKQYCVLLQYSKQVTVSYGSIV